MLRTVDWVAVSLRDMCEQNPRTYTTAEVAKECSIPVWEARQALAQLAADDAIHHYRVGGRHYWRALQD